MLKLGIYLCVIVRKCTKSEAERQILQSLIVPTRLKNLAGKLLFRRKMYQRPPASFYKSYEEKNTLLSSEKIFVYYRCYFVYDNYKTYVLFSFALLLK